MDYYNIYSNSFEENRESIKYDTINTLKLAKANKANFNTKFKGIIDELSRKHDVIYEDFKSQNLTECLRIFTHRCSKVDEALSEDETISFILNNQILNEFNIQGYHDYFEFITKLASFNSINKIKVHFENYYDYYKLVYFTNKYEYFYAKDISGLNFEDSKEYSEMMDLKYPDRIEARFNELILLGNSNNSHKDVLSEKDKFLILHILKSIIEQKKASVIEIARIIQLVHIDNPKLLTDKYKNIDGYKILSSGIDKLDNDKSKIKWISEILEKLEPYKMTQLKAELKLLLRKFKLKQK